MIKRITTKIGRYYLFDNDPVKYWGPSSILRCWPTDEKFFEVIEYLGVKELNRRRDAGGERGTNVHNAIQAYFEKKKLPKLTKEEESYMKGFYKFVEDYEPQDSNCEKIVCSKKYGFGGTRDYLGTVKLTEISKKLTNIRADWKTSKVHSKKYEAQLSAYDVAEVEMGGENVEELWLVYLKPNGYTIKKVKDRELAFQAFLGCYGVFKYEFDL